MRRGVLAFSVFDRPFPLDFATVALFAASIASAKQHLITGAKQFVITDSDEPQLYRLLGVLPYLDTLPSQAVLAAVITLFVGLPVTLYLYLRPRHPYATWTSRLPDWAVNLLFYIRVELDAYWQILLGEAMALMSASTGVGLNTLSSVSTWSPFASCSKQQQQHQQQQQGGHSQRTGRASLRRNVRNSGPQASTSMSSAVAAASSNASESALYPGLYNTGNSCFLNSTLQSLASLEGFQRYLEGVMEMAETWDVPTPATDAMHQLITDLNTPIVRRGALLPRQLTDALSNLPRTNVGSFFHAHQQQDAHELLVLLTSAIDDEVGVINAERDHVLRRQAVGLRAAIAPSIPSLYSSSSFASTSVNPFRSLIAQRTACLDCGYVEAVRHYPTDELSLGVPFRGAGSATTLEMCLRTWSKLERVEWICFQCSLRKTLGKARSDVERLTSVSACGPEILKGMSSNGAQNGSSTTSTNTNSNAKMSNSKKKKLREARKRESVLQMILTNRLSEDEVESAHLLENAEVKLERAYSTLSTKQVMMARTPKVLAIHLNRSSYSASNFGASKNNTPVIFDEYLDIGDVVTNGELNISGSHPISRGSTPALADVGSLHNGTNGSGYLHSSRQQTLYHLSTIVVHYGSHSSGHYVSFRRRRVKTKVTKSDDVDQTESRLSSDLWYRISDDSVSSCTLRTVLSQNPFILFYERVDEKDGQKLVRQAPEGSNSHSTPTTAIGIEDGRAPRMPSGFEAFGKDDHQQKLSAHRPRIVERWNTPVL